MSKTDTADLESALSKLIKADAKVSKPTDTDSLITVTAEPYKDGLAEGGLTPEKVTAVRAYDKAFTRASVSTVATMALDIFKKDKSVENVSSNSIHMLGNKLEVSVDRTKTLKNPGTGEAIVRHGYVTVSAVAGHASGKDIKTLRDELMESAKTALS